MLMTPLAPMRLATQVPVLEGSAFDLALLMVGDGIRRRSMKALYLSRSGGRARGSK